MAGQPPCVNEARLAHELFPNDHSYYAVAATAHLADGTPTAAQSPNPTLPRRHWPSLKHVI
jgi:hypothetical protein